MPFLFERSIDSQIRLGLWKIEDQEEADFRKIKLTDQEYASLGVLKSHGKQTQRLAYRAVLTKIMGRNDFIIYYDEFRKPHLIGFDGQISVSHSGDLAAAMVNMAGPAGIDVEKVSSRIKPIAQRFLSPQEQGECGLHPEELRLTIYWSAKEALFKMDGKRILSFRQDIYIEPFDIQSPGKISGHIKRGTAPGVYSLTWEILGDSVLVYTL